MVHVPTRYPRDSILRRSAPVQYPLIGPGLCRLPRTRLLGSWVNKAPLLCHGTGRSTAPSEFRGSSEHGVVVRRALRHGLQDIPVLDDLAVLQAEEVRRGGAAVFWGGLDQAVRND